MFNGEEDEKEGKVWDTTTDECDGTMNGLLSIESLMSRSFFLSLSRNPEDECLWGLVVWVGGTFSSVRWKKEENTDEEDDEEKVFVGKDGRYIVVSSLVVGSLSPPNDTSSSEAYSALL